jgi:hypothetical protein
MSVQLTAALLVVLPFGLFAASEDPDRNFSGNWSLDRQTGDAGALPAAPAAVLTITQQGSVIHCSEPFAAWSFRIDGQESKYRLKDSTMNSLTKWEGSALMINTLVSGPQNYAIMDRWVLSKDHATLTITRTVQRRASESEVTLVYRNRERLSALAKSAPAAAPALKRAPSPSPVAPEPAGFIVSAGARIPLALVNSISTKHTAPGDRVYLETAFPVAQNGRIIIPRGSYVAGTVTEVKRAGRIKGKAELFLRFDSLTLPNGVTRDFRSRIGNADSGNVDRNEGKIHGEGNKAGDARTVGETTAAGTAVGAIAGSAAGHAGMGAGIGAAGGAAAGLAGVLLSRGPDLVLPKGTTFEMVLDRPLHFEASELLAR